MHSQIRKRVRYIFIGIVVAGLAVIAAGSFFLSRSTSGPKPSQAVYSSQAYQVSFYYPKEWKHATSTKAERYEGESGFFEISAAGANQSLSLDDILNSQAQHAEKPYGSSPGVEYLKAGGAQGGIIWPSEDQDPKLRGQTALILLYPKPLTLGTTTYYYFILFADQYHIRAMVDSLRFLQ